jgi:hypothetical protein
LGRRRLGGHSGLVRSAISRGGDRRGRNTNLRLHAIGDTLVGRDSVFDDVLDGGLGLENAVDGFIGRLRLLLFQIINLERKGEFLDTGDFGYISYVRITD